jgi:DNA-binding transcriptional LysR family regulator
MSSVATLPLAPGACGQPQMPAELARPYADAFGLCVVPLADDWARRRFAIATRGDDTLTPAARLLVEHLEASGRCDGNKFE